MHYYYRMSKQLFDEFIKNDPDLRDDDEIWRITSQYGKLRIVQHDTGIVIYNAIHFWCKKR